jgi:DNA-directed RNA polymerase specialized sigma subunit
MIDEHTTEEQVDHLIRSPWADRMVRGVVKWDAPYLDDLAQEARLEMWRSAGRWDGRGTLEGFLHQNARWRVTSLLRGDHRFTGEEGARAVTQRRGDEARDRLRTAMAEHRTEHGREPKAEEMAKVLGIHAATVRKQIRTLTLTKVDVEVRVSSLDALMDVYGAEALVGIGDTMDAVVLAYHYGEIHKAVADLAPLWREYVYLRFWQGHGDSEATRILGTGVHWSTSIRPVLAERLSHLVGAL